MTPRQRSRAEYLVQQCLAAWRTMLAHRGKAEPVITFALDPSSRQVVYFIDDPDQERPYPATQIREKRDGWQQRGRNPNVAELVALPEPEALAVLRRLRQGEGAVDPEAAQLQPIERESLR